MTDEAYLRTLIDGAVDALKKWPGHHPGLSVEENIAELVKDLSAAEHLLEKAKREEAERNVSYSHMVDALKAAEERTEALEEALHGLLTYVIRAMAHAAPETSK